MVDQSKKGTPISDCSMGHPTFLDVHENNKIKARDTNQNIDDQVNNITKYLIARNKSTEIIDVENSKGIDNNNESKSVFASKNVPKIIDVKSKSIDVVEYIDTIFAEVVDTKNDIHFVSKVTEHILRYEVHYK